jgi:hypothetical protein
LHRWWWRRLISDRIIEEIERIQLGFRNHVRLSGDDWLFKGGIVK